MGVSPLVTRLALLLLVLGAPRASAQPEWRWQHPLPVAHNLYDLTFLDSITAVAVGDAGTIIKTTNAGLTWQVTTKVGGYANTLRSIAAMDENTLVIGGSGGLILRSTDGGVTWANPPSPATQDIFDISVADADTAMALWEPRFHRGERRWSVRRTAAKPGRR